MQLVSLNVGRPTILIRHGRQYSTAINRKPVAEARMLTLSGLEGDRVSDDRVHGGPDKAVCCYSIEHYPYFSKALGVELAVPAFGENFTTAGLLESEVSIGDTFRVGGAVVQITQPRQPCAKLAMKHDRPELVRWINETAFSGFYFRVLAPGEVAPGDGLTLAKRASNSMSVAAAMNARLSQPADLAALRRLLDAPGLSAAWREQVRERMIAGNDADHEA